MTKPWIVSTADHDRAQAWAQELSICPATAFVLLARGTASVAEARRWLSGEARSGHDPFLLPDMEVAVDRIHAAVRGGERMCFYGDYDVDGITATSLYLKVFGARGAKASVYIPHRIEEGYGLNEQAVVALRDSGVTLLVTSDCGTTSHREINIAKSLGMDVIVTDHHQLDGEHPAALAALNPHREDSRYPFTGLCSGGLAYKVAQAYQVKYGEEGYRLDDALDLVAMATVADVVPLQEENRWFVKEGLRQISGGRRCGLRALKAQAGVGGACTTHTVAFKLAPRINAAGRLAHALSAVRLLTTEVEEEALQLAQELEGLNKERQRMEEIARAEAVAMLENVSAAAGLVVHDRKWHLGVVGIVAARLVERFHRPAVVLAVNEHGVAKGSARTVPGLDLYETLSSCRDLLLGFGGHPSAAGVTLQEENIPQFRERFAEAAERRLGVEPEKPGLPVDAEVNLREVTHQLVRELDRLQPFGMGNPEPTLAVRNLSVLEARVVGAKHLRLTVRQKDSAPFVGIGFRMGALAQRAASAGGRVDLAFIPELDRWNGLDRLQLRIRDLRSSQST